MDCKTTRLYIDPNKKKENENWKWKKKRQAAADENAKLEDDEEDDYEESMKERAEKILMRLKEKDP